MSTKRQAQRIRHPYKHKSSTIRSQHNPIQYQHRSTTDAGAKAILKVLLKHPIVVVNVGTGGGKTFMAIRAIGVFKPCAHVIVLTTRKQVDSHSWQNSFKAYNQAVSNAHLTYNVVNYEALNSKNKQQEFIKKLKAHCQQPLYIVADEGHRIKNPQSKNFKHVKKFTHLANFQGTICLTATPISESLLDTQAYLILAGYYRNKTDFIRQHVTRLDKYFQPIVKDRSGKIHNEWLLNYQQIIQQFKSIQVHIDTTKLKPKVIYKQLTFEFDKATQHQYRQIKKDYLAGVYDSTATANAAQRDFVALHDTQRTKALTSIIDNPKRPQGPILIFYQYNTQRDRLLTYLKQHHPTNPIYQINGQHKYDVSITPPNNALFLCQYQASGEGLNAPWSHLSNFYEPTYSWEKFKQARGRNVRAYQGGTTIQIRFVVRKTINQHYWYDLIDNKKTFTTNLMQQYLTNDD